MVYELFFSYYDQDPENDEEMIIAAYSSYEKAESARKKLLEQPRFKGKEDFFEIHDFKMNEPWWDEGFWRATRSYFIIQLLRFTFFHSACTAGSGSSNPASIAICISLRTSSGVVLYFSAIFS